MGGTGSTRDEPSSSGERSSAAISGPDIGPGARSDDGRHSNFRLALSLSVEYQRKRARLASQFETTLTSVLLLVGGIVLVLLFVYGVLSRLGAF